MANSSSSSDMAARLARDRTSRMLRDARARTYDADLLSQNMLRATDSDALLRILGFEILLKCALHVCGAEVGRHHRYNDLWDSLPADARDSILSTANLRMPGHADLSNLQYLLKWYQFIFEKGRYHYELYEDYSAEEQLELETLWASVGAPTDESIVQYHPNELRCLIHGLEQFVEGKIMPDPNDEYQALCRAETEAERHALELSAIIRETMAFEDGAWIGVPTSDVHDDEQAAWQKVEELRRLRRAWVLAQK